MLAIAVSGARLLAVALVAALTLPALATCGVMAMPGACGSGGPMGAQGIRAELIFACSAMDVDGEPLYRLYRLHAHGAEQLSSAPAQNPAVNRSGSSLAYDSTAAGTPNIYVSGVSGGGRHEVVQAPGGQTEPAWAPDGSLLAYVSGEHGLHAQVGISGTFGSVFVAGVGSAGGQAITPDGSYAGQPAWAPDQKRIAYATDVHGFFQVATVAPDGNGPRLFLTNKGQAQWPTWSPNSEQIAYQASSSLDGDDWIWVMNGDGGKAHRLTQGSRPSWSPDGKWIAFVRKTAEGSDLWMIPARGGHAVRITDDSGLKGRPSWV